MTGTTLIDDVTIIDEILAGNKEKYELLMRRYNTSLYRIAKGILTDEQEIEDAMQEAYIKAYRQLANFERRSTFKTWLTRILLNECLMKKRQEKRAAVEFAEPQLLPHQQEKNTPEKTMMNKELKQVLESAISSLPEKYRIVFLMREVEQMSISETTHVLDISEGNVKARLSRAKEMLRNHLLAGYPAGNLFEFNAIRCSRIVQNVFAKI
jgi:RNA polymerase sigma factor (sigma-70 family)